MKKLLSTVLTVTFIGLGAGVVLGMSPAVEASNPSALSGKGNRVDVRPVGSDCSERSWPYYEATCLRNADQATGPVRTVRIVSTDRISFRQ